MIFVKNIQYPRYGQILRYLNEVKVPSALETPGHGRAVATRPVVATDGRSFCPFRFQPRTSASGLSSALSPACSRESPNLFDSSAIPLPARPAGSSGSRPCAARSRGPFDPFARTFRRTAHRALRPGS